MIWLAVIGAAFLAWFILVTLFRSQEVNQYEVDYTKYLEYLKDGKIVSEQFHV